MGWTFSNWTRDEMIHDLTQPGECEAAHYETIAHTLHDNVLWSVLRITARLPGVLGLDPGKSATIIVCHLLEGRGSRWGYKAMDESMHPFYYACPLAYLAMAPEQSSPWREGVRTWHAQQPTPAAA